MSLKNALSPVRSTTTSYRSPSSPSRSALATFCSSSTTRILKKPRVVAQRLEAVIERDVHQRRIALLAGLVQQGKGLVGPAQRDLWQRQVIGGHEPLLPEAIQGLQKDRRHRAVASYGLRVRQPAKQHGILRSNRRRRLELCDGLRGATELKKRRRQHTP